MIQKHVIIGSDHAGYNCKKKILSYLQSRNFIVDDRGAHSESSVDYPDVAHSVAKAVDNQSYDFGILICGSGIGVSIVANKYRLVRAALCWTAEISTLSRQHNNANILCLPSRFVDEQTAIDCVRAFFDAKFEGGRHENRVKKISAPFS